ncbi:MAG: DUF4159 domain-containing protein [Phycisphaerae bacterium]
MGKIGRLLLILTVAISALAPRLFADEKWKSTDFSDEKVEQAIKDLAERLWQAQEEDGSFGGHGDHPVGPTAIATYALLESGVSVQNPKMAKALDWMSKQPCHKTYSMGLRAQAWLEADRQSRGKYIKFLRDDVDTLVKSTAVGAYGYDVYGIGKSHGDNSCSQYGLLGVWAGVLANIEIDSRYWQLVENHWLRTQNPDGSWAYKGGGGRNRVKNILTGQIGVLKRKASVLKRRVEPAQKKAEHKITAMLRGAGVKIEKPNNKQLYLQYLVEKLREVREKVKQDQRKVARVDELIEELGQLIEKVQEYKSIENRLDILEKIASGKTKTHGDGNARATMVAAGIASLYVCVDNLRYAQFADCGVKRTDTTSDAIQAGLDWMDRNFEDSLNKGSRLYYYLYGVERIGLASGYKYFGKIDWYKMGTRRLLYALRKDRNKISVPDAAFAILFLVRGRNPVLYNKLEFDGDWNNRPRDMAMLTRWTSETFERTVNWQIINLQAPVREWHDAPILYISGSQAPKFTDEQLEKLRSFVYQGGTIFSVAECNGKGFQDGIREVYTKLFPNLELTECGDGHPVYDVHFKLKGEPKLHEINNGVRSLVIHSDGDLARAWQLRRTQSERAAFEAAANIYLLQTDKGSLRSRGTNPWPADYDGQYERSVTLAQLKHAGNYNPEPLAFKRFALKMAHETQTNVKLTGPIDIEKLADSGADVATLTSSGPISLTAAEKTALKKWIEGGGLLIIDAAGGDTKAYRSAEDLVDGMFGRRSARPVLDNHPVLNVENCEIRGVSYRRNSRGNKKTAPDLRAVEVDGRAGVFLSPEDITSGLVGYPSFTISGYEPGSAFALMRNFALYSLKPDSKN